MSEFLISRKDYEQIYKTIYSILKSETTNTLILQSCICFSIAGAFMLKEIYCLDATIAGGIAAYKVGNGDHSVATFADVSQGQFFCSENGFHCWVEANGWLIDFMAPIFPDAITSVGYQTKCESKMMQKSLDQMADSISSLETPGDFYVQKFPTFKDKIINIFLAKSESYDLLETLFDCSLLWYKRPPEKMYERVSITDRKGNIKNFSLQGKSLVGAW
ncbi:MAG: DUF2026 family protein [Cyanobacteria bacterium P01_A01_bin.80]